MRILCHRGWWLKPEEQNTIAAFLHAFENGMGVETDVRDCLGALVIAHNPPSDNFLPLTEFISVYNDNGIGLPMALNIKADGLQPKISAEISGINSSDYFVFDMSTPDTLPYLKNEVPFFTRQSEYEPVPAFYENAVGVWMDCFESEWYVESDIRAHLNTGKLVCLVSPELHKRSYEDLWEMLFTTGLCWEQNMLLCTDFPEEACFKFAL